jgi:large subunit ribosomal protein L18
MDSMKYKRQLRRNRALRKRKKARGTAERPRLSVYRSARHIYVQLIDDAARHTLCSMSSQAKEVSNGGKKKTEVAGAVGEKMGEKTKALGIERVRFDIGPYKYHGRVKALAEGFLKSGVAF